MTDCKPIVMGVDPGGTTGLATWVSGRWHALQIADPADVRPFVEGWVATMRARNLDCKIHIGTERYVNASGRGARTTQNDALDINNALVSMASVMDPHCTWLFVEQQAAGDAKKILDVQLRRLLMHLPGMGHANDATRHMMLNILKHYPLEYLRILEGEFLVMGLPAGEVLHGVR